MGLLDFIIHVGVDAASAHKEFDTLGAKIGAVSGHVGKTLAATFSVGAIAHYVKSTVEATHANKELADQLGTTSEWIEKIQKLAAKKHVDPESVFGALGKAEKFMGDALDPDRKDNKKLDMLKSLGLGLKDISGAGADAMNVLLAFGRAVDGVGGTLEQRQMARELFGRKGSRIANLLKDLPGTKATLTPEERESEEVLGETLEETERTAKRLMKKAVAKWVSGSTALGKMIYKAIGYHRPDAEGNEWGGVTTGGASGEWGDDVMADKTPEKTAKQIAADAKAEEARSKAESEAKFYFQEHQKWLKDEDAGLHQKSSRGGRTQLGDSLSAIGGFVGGSLAVAGSSGFAEKSLTLQERTARATEGIVTKLDDGTTFG